MYKRDGTFRIKTGLRREAATRAAFHFGQCVYLGGHFGLAPLIAQLGGEESVYLLPLGAADADRLWLVSPVEDRLSKQGQPAHAVGHSLLGQSDALSVDRYVGVRCFAGEDADGVCHDLRGAPDALQLALPIT